MKNKVISILLVAMIIILGAMSISFAKDSLDGTLIAAKTSSSSSSKKGSIKICKHKNKSRSTSGCTYYEIRCDDCGRKIS